MSEPKVSVVIPTYKAKYLEKAIRSISAQTYKNIEIIVSDNCPGDEVRKVVSRHPEIRYFHNPVTGVYSNFRNAMRLAGGDYVKFLLDDDLLAPRCLERMLECFERFPKATLVAGWYYKIDSKGQVTDLKKLNHKKVLVLSGQQAGSDILSRASNFIGPLTTFMFRRSALPQGAGPWFFNSEAPDRYFGLMDVAIILDLAFQGDVVVFPRPLSAMRFHKDQLSNLQRNPKAASSLKSWLPLAEDAHALELISDNDLKRSQRAILEMYRRWRERLPELESSIKILESRLNQLGRI